MSYRNENYVQADYGKYSICKNLDEIHFSDVYELRKILGERSKVLEGKTFLWYCTDEGKESLVDEVTGEVDFSVKPDLEAIMDDVQIFIDRQEDPFYGMSTEDKFKAGIKHVQIMLRNRLRPTDQFLLVDSQMSPDEQKELIKWRQICRDYAKSINTFEEAMSAKFPELPEGIKRKIAEEEPYFTDQP